MNIQYASDLHLEFPKNWEFLKANPLQPKAPLLLLAGDIVPFAVMDKYADFFSWASDHFETTYWIPGNHEYYYSDVADRSGVINEKIRSNVFLINNQMVKIDDIRILFSVLWSNISPANYWTAQQNISDFQVIKFNKEPFTPEQFNKLHKDCLQFISANLQEKHPGKTVVVTHHVPSFMNYPSKYKGSELNEVFATELHELIENTNPNYWIYGHHHHNTPPFKIGNTSLITNQLGYVQHNEHIEFSPNIFINL